MREADREGREEVAAGKGGGFPARRSVVDIDDIDDIDDPRTEGRRQRVRLESGTPEDARKAEGGGCAGIPGRPRTHGRPKVKGAPCGGG